MIGTYKFPNGNDVNVYKREDIIKCISLNITDQSIALALVEDCERQCADFIKRGRWASVPFIGNFRIPKHIELEQTPEQQQLIQDAKDVLNNKDYVLFRQQLGKDNAKQVAKQRYFNYEVSKMIRKNNRLYSKLLKRLSEAEVHIRFYSFRKATYVAPTNEEIDYGYE